MPSALHRRPALAAFVTGRVEHGGPIACRHVALDLDAFRALGADVGELVVIECLNGDVLTGELVATTDGAHVHVGVALSGDRVRVRRRRP